MAIKNGQGEKASWGRGDWLSYEKFNLCMLYGDTKAGLAFPGLPLFLKRHPGYFTAHKLCLLDIDIAKAWVRFLQEDREVDVIFPLKFRYVYHIHSSFETLALWKQSTGPVTVHNLHMTSAIR